MGEPAVSLLEMPEEEGYRLIKSPRRWSSAPIGQRTACRTQTKGASKVPGSEPEAKRPGRDRGDVTSPRAVLAEHSTEGLEAQSSRLRRRGTEAQGTR